MHRVSENQACENQRNVLLLRRDYEDVSYLFITNYKSSLVLKARLGTNRVDLRLQLCITRATII